VAVEVLFKSVSAEILYLAAVPVSYFLSHYFVFTRKRILPGILFVVLFVLTAAVQIAGLFK
jgi:putative flippase GtrA